MKKNLAIALIVSMAFCLIACSHGGAESFQADSFTVPEPTHETTPSEVFKRYWDLAAEGKLDEAVALTTDPPDDFLSCYSISEAECDEKLKAEAARPKRANGVRLEMERENSLITENIPGGIKKGFWKSYQLNRETIKNKDARLNITVRGSGFALRRDVLLYETDSGWRIFTIFDEGEVEAFAPTK